MARFPRLEVYQRMMDIGIIPVFYNADLDVAKEIVRACVAGGATVVEFTNRGDLAYQVFSELVAWARQELRNVILGVGSVIDGPTCALYLSCGANFVVGPVFSPEAAKVANKRKVAYIPGCGSATEISQAEELGAEIVKIFPGGQVGGPAFVKAISGPCPWTSIMPTGGVDPTEESLTAWLGAGAACVGMGSKLIRKDHVQSGNFAGIQQEVGKAVSIVQKLRKK